VGVIEANADQHRGQRAPIIRKIQGAGAGYLRAVADVSRRRLNSKGSGKNLAGAPGAPGASVAELGDQAIETG
jgi:hypothetical protein